MPELTSPTPTLISDSLPTPNISIWLVPNLLPESSLAPPDCYRSLECLVAKLLKFLFSYALVLYNYCFSFTIVVVSQKLCIWTKNIKNKTKKNRHSACSSILPGKSICILFSKYQVLINKQISDH